MVNDIKLFDKRFVYYMWDESLIGKEGFFSDSIRGLIIGVNGNNGVRGVVLEESSEINREFTSVNKSMWKFFYYDPLYYYKWQYYKGRKVQYKFSDRWFDVNKDCAWKEDFEYRVIVEEDKKCPSRLTYKQLAKWLARGNGQMYKGKTGFNYNQLIYKEIYDDCPTPVGYYVRKWDDTEWHEPTTDYCFPEFLDKEPDSAAGGCGGN